VRRVAQQTAPPGTGPSALAVPGVYVHRFEEFSDLRGRLVAGELPNDFAPFVPQRWFLVSDVPSREVRGEHAHRVCHEFLVCVAGSVMVAADDGHRRDQLLLDGPAVGVYVPPLIWTSQFRNERDTVRLVRASHAYDPDDYIRDYDEFLAAVIAREPRISRSADPSQASNVSAAADSWSGRPGS